PWSWTGSDGYGIGGPDTSWTGMGHSQTWGKLTFQLSATKVPDFEMAGIPQKASHFGAIPDHHPVVNLAWITGGKSTIDMHEGFNDSIDVQPSEYRFNPDKMKPTGALQMSFEFIWDKNRTHVDIDVGPSPLNLYIPAQFDARPRGTPDCGW